MIKREVNIKNQEEEHITESLVKKCTNDPLVRKFLNMMFRSAIPLYKGSDPQFVIAAHHRRECIDVQKNFIKKYAKDNFSKMLIEEIKDRK